jgi:hypothetical protein
MVFGYRSLFLILVALASQAALAQEAPSDDRLVSSFVNDNLRIRMLAETALPDLQAGENFVRVQGGQFLSPAQADSVDRAQPYCDLELKPGIALEGKKLLAGRKIDLAYRGLVFGGPDHVDAISVKAGDRSFAGLRCRLPSWGDFTVADMRKVFGESASVEIAAPANEGPAIPGTGLIFEEEALLPTAVRDARPSDVKRKLLDERRRREAAPAAADALPAV